MHLPRVVLLSVLLLSLPFTFTSYVSAQQEQCTLNPPAISPNPDGSITVDLGDCFIFPGAGPGYDITDSVSVALQVTGPLHLSSLTYSPFVPEMQSTWTIEICAAGAGCDGAPAGGTLVTAVRHLWIADYGACWSAGYYCWYSAKVTLR